MPYKLQYFLHACRVVSQFRQSIILNASRLTGKFADIKKALHSRAQRFTIKPGSNTERERRSMIYTDGNTIKRLLKERAKQSGITLSRIAEKAGMSPQALNNRFLRKDISLTEISRIAAASGFQVDIDIIKRIDQTGDTSANQDSSGMG